MTIEYALYKNDKGEVRQITPDELMNYPENEKDFIKESLYCSTPGCECSITFAEPREMSNFHPQFKTFKNKNHLQTCPHFFIRRENGSTYYPNQKIGANQSRDSNSRSNRELLKALFGGTDDQGNGTNTTRKKKKRKKYSDVNGSDIEDRPNAVTGVSAGSPDPGSSESKTPRIRQKELNNLTIRDVGKQRRTTVQIISIEIKDGQLPILNVKDPMQNNRIGKIYLPTAFFSTINNNFEQILDFFNSIKKYIDNNPNINVYIVSIMEVNSVDEKIIELSILNSDFPEFSIDGLVNQGIKYYIDGFVSVIVTRAI